MIMVYSAAEKKRLDKVALKNPYLLILSYLTILRANLSWTII